MNRRIAERRVYAAYGTIALGFVLWLGTIGVSAQEPSLRSFPGAKRVHAPVKLLSFVDGVAPGRSFHVALAYEIEEGWHIYWKNPGDSGLPPSVDWTLPAGFLAGELQFPAPERHVSPGDIVSYVHHDKPVFLAKITPPAQFSGDRVTLSANVRTLVCAKQCIPEQTTLSIDLPVLPAGAGPKPQHDDVWKRAEAFAPKASSMRLAIAPTLVMSGSKPRDPVELTLQLIVTKGWHIQSHKPLQEGLVGCDIFLETVPGVTWEAPKYPQPQIRQDTVLGSISEYAGTVAVPIHGTIDDEPPTGPVRAAGVLLYQACNDRGQCSPPETLSFATDTLTPPGMPSAGGPSATPERAAVNSNADGPSPTISGTTAPSISAAVPTLTLPAPGEDTILAMSIPVSEPLPLATIILFAFLGGLILNVMPCVLPVISIKVLSFMHQAKDEPRRVFRLGASFFAGIMVSFELLALAVIILLRAGTNVGWGFQFQSPLVVLISMTVIFLFALSLFGVFTITLPGGAITKLSVAEEREGYLGAFMKGVLATVLATPCTAPILGTAMSYAFSKETSPARLIGLFTMVGLGMGLPYLALTWNPSWMRFLPRPGHWMEHFKQFMGFVVLGTVAWMLFSFGQLVGADGVAWAVAFLCFLGLSAWILGRQTPLTSLPKRLAAWASSVAVFALGWWFCFFAFFTLNGGQEHVRMVNAATAEIHRNAQRLCEVNETNMIDWIPWKKGLPEELSKKGFTVYVDYTAEWCVTCKANKKTSLDTADVAAKMRDGNVKAIRADYTAYDEDIYDELQMLGRSGVPTNVVYPAGKPRDPIVLPEVLLPPSIVLKALDAAGQSWGCNELHVARVEEGVRLGTQ